MKAARLYYSLGKTEKSLELLTNLINRKPPFEEVDKAIMLLAKIRTDSSDFKEALALYKELLINYPDSFYGEKARELARIVTKKIEETESQ